MPETKIVGGVPTGATFGVPGGEMIVDPTFGAARVKLSPNEFMNQGQVGGHYQVAQVTGLLTVAAAASAMFSFRWAPPAGGPTFAVLKRLQMGWIMTTAFSAAQVVDFDVVRCTAFTAADTGGTALTPFTGNNQKARTGLMGTSQVADMRISTTSALGAGTKTQDANPFGYLPSPTASTAGNTALVTGSPLVDLYKEDAIAQHPQMFGNNEGFNIRVVTLMGTAGVLKAYVVVTWAEVPGL